MPSETSLHLIDQASQAGCATTLALMAASLDEHSEVLLLGGRAFEARATSAGVGGADRSALPGGPVGFAAAGLHRALKRKGEPGLFHCWSIRSLALAALVRPTANKLLSLTQWSEQGEVSRLRRILRRQPGRVRIVTASHGITAQLVTLGVPREVVRTVSPGLEDPKTAQAITRAGLHDRLGIDRKAPVIALLADPPQGADARQAALAVGLVAESMNSGAASTQRLSPRVLMSPDQHEGPAARRFMRSLRAEHVVVQCAALAEPWRVLPGCDAAICLSDVPGTLSLAWAMRLGVPVAAQRCAVTAGWLTHETTGLLSAGGEAKSLAHQIERLLREPDLAKRLARAAAEEARSRFDRGRYRALMIQAATDARRGGWVLTSEPVESRDLPPGVLEDSAGA